MHMQMYVTRSGQSSIDQKHCFVQCTTIYQMGQSDSSLDSPEEPVSYMRDGEARHAKSGKDGWHLLFNDQLNAVTRASEDRMQTVAAHFSADERLKR